LEILSRVVGLSHDSEMQDTKMRLSLSSGRGCFEKQVVQLCGERRSRLGASTKDSSLVVRCIGILIGKRKIGNQMRGIFSRGG
jgi:hypothetical protein